MSRAVVLASLLAGTCALVGCVGFVAGPEGMKCGAMDANVGGGSESAAMAQAMRVRACGGNDNVVPTCCVKALGVFTRSCPLPGYISEGADCLCLNGVVTLSGVACDYDPG